jgi:hypothetical protein
MPPRGPRAPYHPGLHGSPWDARVESGLWIILLEAAVALGLLLFIVWWTWPKK